jgi:hypothetical protein
MSKAFSISMPVEEGIMLIMGNGTFASAGVLQKYLGYGFTIKPSDSFFTQSLHSLVGKGFLKRYYEGGEYYYRKANLSNPFASSRER